MFSSRYTRASRIHIYSVRVNRVGLIFVAFVRTRVHSCTAKRFFTQQSGKTKINSPIHFRYAINLGFILHKDFWAFTKTTTKI